MGKSNSNREKSNRSKRKKGDGKRRRVAAPIEKKNKRSQ
jgi:hypothetical protein